MPLGWQICAPKSADIALGRGSELLFVFAAEVGRIFVAYHWRRQGLRLALGGGLPEGGGSFGTAAGSPVISTPGFFEEISPS